MKTIYLALLICSLNLFARDYLIYSISQDLPMGEDKEIIRKNYYINMGQTQGLNKGTKLNVFRRLSKLNPYDNEKRINYNVKVGELEIIHADDTAAIAVSSNINVASNDPIVDLKYFMIGDTVSVKTKD